MEKTVGREKLGVEPNSMEHHLKCTETKLETETYHGHGAVDI